MSKISDDLGLARHPLIIALLRQIPPTGSKWPADDRMRWLRAFNACANFILGTDVEVEFSEIDQIVVKL